MYCFNVFMGLRGILLYPAAKDSSRMPFPPLCVRMRFLILLDLPTTIKEAATGETLDFFQGPAFGSTVKKIANLSLHKFLSTWNR